MSNLVMGTETMNISIKSMNDVTFDSPMIINKTTD